MLDHAPLAWSRYVVGRRPTSQRRTVVLVLRVRLEGHTDRDLDRSQRDGEVSTHQSSPPRSPRPMTRRRPIWNKLRGSCKQDVSSFTQHHPRPWPCDIGRKASSTRRQSTSNHVRFACFFCSCSSRGESRTSRGYLADGPRHETRRSREPGG